MRSWSRRRAILSLAGLVSGLLLLQQADRARLASAGEPPKAAAAWRDAKTLEARLSEACDAVEAVCGAKYEKRPTIRVSTAAEVGEILRRELEPQLKAMGQADALDGSIEILSVSVIAKYEPGAHVIHVLPENAERLSKELEEPTPPTEEELRVVLAHEATHALDFLRFPLHEAVAKRTTSDGIRTVAAVEEGHAQWVAEQVAAKWGLSDEFARFTRSITAIAPSSKKEVKRLAGVMAAEFGFTYVQGHAFVKAIFAAKGREGVEAVLRDPPSGTRLIEHPELYLESPAGPAAPDLDGVLDALRPLVGDPVWKTVSTRILESTLKSLVDEMPAERQKDFLRGYEDGRILMGVIEQEPVRVIAMATLFKAPADAATYLSVTRDAAKAKLAEPPDGPFGATGEMAEGAGPKGRLTGFSVHVHASAMGEDQTADTQVFTLGRVVVQLLVLNAPDLDRAAQDEALVRVEAFLIDPAAARAAPKPEPRKISKKTKTLVVRVTDPDGKPVAKARVLVSAGDFESPFGASQHRGVVVDGKASIDMRKKAAKATVYAAADGAGAPLPFAPSRAFDVAEDAVELDVRLEPGVAIEGVVRDEAGTPVAGAVVGVVRGEDSPDAPPGFADFDDEELFLGKATTAADGTFRVVGLGSDAYAIRARVATPTAVSAARKTRGGARDVSLTVRRVLAFPLTLVDEKGEPVEGARLRLMERLDGGSRTAFHGVSGPDGVVQVTGLNPAARFDLEVEPPPARDDLATLDEREFPAKAARVVLPRGYTVSGVVQDEKGVPLQAQLIRKTHDGWRGEMTERDGTFVLRGLPYGPVSLKAGRAEASGASPGFPSDDEDDVGWTVVTPGKADVVLRLPPEAGPGASVVVKGSLLIRVLDPDGRPVARASISFQSDGYGEMREARNGSVSLKTKGAAGKVRISAAKGADGKPLAFAPVTKEVSAGQTEIEVRFVPGMAIEGHVRDEAGVGVAGVRLSATRVEAFQYVPDATAVTAKDGAFRLVGVGSEEYSIAVEGPTPSFVAPLPVKAKGGASDVAITLRRGQSRTITVVDAAGKPVAGVGAHLTRARITGPGSTWSDTLFQGETDSEGVVVLPPFASDAAGVSLDLSIPADRDDLSALKIDLAGRSLENERIEMPRGYVVTGTVRDADGKPARARVTWIASGGTVNFGGRDSGGDGAFRLRGVPIGSVEVTAVALSDSGKREGASVSARATVENPRLDLKLPPDAVVVRVKVAGAKAGRFVRIRSEGEEGSAESMRFAFGDDGVATLPEITPGAFTVWIPPATDDDTRCFFAKGVQLGGGDVSFELVEGKPIRARLKVPDESTQVQFDVFGPFGLPLAMREVEPGTYVSLALPPGRWTVKAKARAPNAWVRATVEAEAGSEIDVEAK